MNPVLRWHTTADVELTAEQALGEVITGAESAPVSYRLYNDRTGAAGSDDATDLVIQAEGRDQGETSWYAAGREVVDQFWVTAQITAGLGGLDVSAFTSPVALGAGVYLTLPTIPSTQGVEIEITVSPPAGATRPDQRFILRTIKRRSLPVAGGVSLSAGQGVHSGLGEWSRSALLRYDGAAENPGGADTDVYVGDMEGVVLGRSFGIPLTVLTFNNLDSAAAALGAGEAYKARIYVDEDSALAVVKGAKAASAGAAVAPSLPADAQIPLAQVVVTDALVIQDADITDESGLWGFAWSATLLAGSISGGRGFVGDRIIDCSTPDAVALTASTTARIYRLPTAALELVTAGPPAHRDADPLYEVTTDGSGVTELRDLRRFAGVGHQLLTLSLEHVGTLVVDQFAYGAIQPGRDVQILPMHGWRLALFDDPGSGGQVVTDLEYKSPGSGSWVSVSPSAPTVDGRPVVANGASDLAAWGIAETRTIPGGSLVRSRVKEITSGAAPTGAVVTVLLGLVP